MTFRTQGDEPDTIVSKVENTILHLKIRKAPGLNDITAELIKNTQNKMVQSTYYVYFKNFGRQDNGLTNGKSQFSFHCLKMVMSPNVPIIV